MENLYQPLCLLNLCCRDRRLLKEKNQVLIPLFCLLHPLVESSDRFVVNIHQMTNILSPLRVWPLTQLINGNSGRGLYFFFPFLIGGVISPFPLLPLRECIPSPCLALCNADLEGSLGQLLPEGICIHGSGVQSFHLEALSDRPPQGATLYVSHFLLA